MDNTPKKKGRPRKIKSETENVEKIKKKRGRKKKEKTQEQECEEIEKTKKKRGRKNIVNYYSTHEKIDLKNVVEKNILLKLNISEKDNPKPQFLETKNIQPVSNKLDVCNKNTEEITDDDNILLADFLKEWKTKTDVLCWWCAHNFGSVPLSLPVYYDKRNMYRTFGIFCSFPCLLAYNNENNVTCKSKINHLYFKLTGKFNHDIKPASSRYVLKNFGGTVDIKDFRKNDNIYEMIKYPMYITRTFIKETPSTTNKNTKNTNNKTDRDDDKNIIIQDTDKQTNKKSNFLSNFISCKSLT